MSWLMALHNEKELNIIEMYNNKQYVIKKSIQYLEKNILQINGVYMIKQKCTLPFTIRNHDFSKSST
jgi:hypothetical protein